MTVILLAFPSGPCTSETALETNFTSNENLAYCCGRLQQSWLQCSLVIVSLPAGGRGEESWRRPGCVLNLWDLPRLSRSSLNFSRRLLSLSLGREKEAAEIQASPDLSWKKISWPVQCVRSSQERKNAAPGWHEQCHRSLQRAARDFS